MAKSGKSREELVLENRILRRSRFAEGGWSVIRTAIKYGAVAFVAYEGRKAVEALAGHETTASFITNVFLSGGINKWLAWTIAGLSVGWATVERRLRRNQIRRLGHRNAKLEQAIDPKRSSSGLDPWGDTSPDDRE